MDAASLGYFLTGWCLIGAGATILVPVPRNPTLAMIQIVLFGPLLWITMFVIWMKKKDNGR